MFDRSRQIAVTSGTFAGDVRRVPALARQMGFAGVQLATFSPALNLPDLSESGRREFRRLFVTQQVELPSISLELGPKGLGPGADVDRELHRISQGLQLARELGVPIVCVDIGVLPPAPPAPPKPKVTQDLMGQLILPPAPDPVAPPPPAPPADLRFAEQVDSALIDLGQHADRYTVGMAFRTDLSGFAALERALNAANCPWFGVDLDPVALLRDEWSGEEIFSRFGTSIRHIRGRDAVTGDNGRTRPAIVGQGNADWPDLFSHLDDADYRGWITIDPFEALDRPAAATAGLAKIRSILRERLR